MELVIKFCADHSVQIGVRFVYEYLAVKPYERIVSQHGTERFSTTLEPSKGHLRLVLRSDDDGGKCEYRELPYKADQLKKLQSFCEAGRVPIRFVHVYPKENRLYIARPFRQHRFVNVSHVTFIGMEG